jgi:hypothetical protein
MPALTPERPLEQALAPATAMVALAARLVLAPAQQFGAVMWREEAMRKKRLHPGVGSKPSRSVWLSCRPSAAP